jgi:hypothetical protein
MWGTDATATFTATEGSVTIFAAVDHCTAECVGIHAVKKATRFEALDPIRQGVKEHCEAFSAGAADGLKLRHDHGSVYMSDDFQNEIQFLVHLYRNPVACWQQIFRGETSGQCLRA